MIKRWRAWWWYRLGLLWQFYGILSTQQPAFLRAESAFCYALELHPAYVEAQFKRGLLYWRELHYLPQAIADFTAVLNHFPEALFMRGMAQQESQNYQAAAEDLQLFLLLQPHSRWHANASRQLNLILAILDEFPRQLTNGGQGTLGAGD